MSTVRDYWLIYGIEMEEWKSKWKYFFVQRILNRFQNCSWTNGRSRMENSKHNTKRYKKKQTNIIISELRRKRSCDEFEFVVLRKSNAMDHMVWLLVHQFMNSKQVFSSQLTHRITILIWIGRDIRIPQNRFFFKFKANRIIEFFIGWKSHK